MNKLKFKPTTTKHNNNTNHNNQLTPELNHHSFSSQYSRSLAQALPTKNKRWNSSSQKPAFTIIEVVLVLAIAGLIFLMVFIALPALQRNQRDTQRKQNLARVASELQNYAANNKGKYPAYGADSNEFYNFARNYLGWTSNGGVPSTSDGIIDPSTGRNPSFWLDGLQPDSMAIRYNRYTEIYYARYRTCPTTTPNQTDYKENGVYVWQVLEGGGVHCIDVR